jgi:hypothetical protein
VQPYTPNAARRKLPSHEEVMMSQLTRKELIKLYRLHGEDGIRKIRMFTPHSAHIAWQISLQ